MPESTRRETIMQPSGGWMANRGTAPGGAGGAIPGKSLPQGTLTRTRGRALTACGNTRAKGRAAEVSRRYILWKDAGSALSVTRDASDEVRVPELLGPSVP